MACCSRPAWFVVGVLGALAVARAQVVAPVALPAVVTTATRTAADVATLGSAVDVFAADDLARRQVTSLAGALGGVAAQPLAASGAAGAVTSLFLRGANSNQTLFLVDGLRLNDANTDYAVFLGGACLGACDSLEVAHGPQGTLYGGEAVGGVISLRAERGRGAPSGRIAAEAGAFGTRQGSLALQGERGADAWNVSLQGGRTDNERPNNRFSSANAVLRFDHTLSPRASAGATLRWFHGDYGDPGDRFTNDPDNTEREGNVLATAFLDLRPGPDWTVRGLLGGQDRRFVAEVPRVGRVTQVTVVKNRRGLVDTQATFSGWEGHRVTTGLAAEANHTRNTGFGDINRRQGLWAAFAQDEWSAGHDIFLTAGLRNDDFDTFGRATTGRLTAAWRLVPGRLKLRASHGTAFRSPSFLDLYGTSAFYTGNPALRPERARGTDAGIDLTLPGGWGTAGITWFDTRFRDLIASTPDFRSVWNIQRAATRGVEATALIRRGGTEFRLAATALEADNLTTGRRLLRRPRYRASADVVQAFGPRWTAGMGLLLAAQREDVDARTYRVVDGEDYVVLRAHLACQVTSRLTFRARLENALDERYEDVNGYPALGRGAFAGLEWRW